MSVSSYRSRVDRLRREVADYEESTARCWPRQPISASRPPVKRAALRAARSEAQRRWKDLFRVHSALVTVLALLVTLASPPAMSVAARSVKLPAIMYHKFGSTAERYQVTPAAFAKHMSWLKANGYRTVSVKRIYDYMYRGGSLPTKPVLITFDDGYASQSSAVEELNARGMKGTFFVLGQGNGLSWGQLRQMVAQGHEVGSHSMTHPYLTKLSDAQLRREVSESKRVLQEKLGVSIPFFAYPYGNVNSRVSNAVAAAGYRGALHAWGGAHWTPTKRWVEPRIEISGVESLSKFAQRVRGATG